MTLSTKDNREKALTIEEMKMHGENLKWMSQSNISQLCGDENPNLLIFPQTMKEYGDDISNGYIFQMKGEKLVTNNIMGFVGRGDTQVRIQSRFASGDEDYFLHYMLQKVFAINLFDLKYSSDAESIFDFLMYLFPTFLKRAVKQGVYKEYQTRCYNDSNVKGRIDVGKHIRLNIPFVGKVAYHTREYATDNHVTQLIRHTIEYIANHAFCGNILTNDEDTKEAVNLFNAVTPTYNKNDRRKVINQNLRPVHHPYFSEYGNLQRLCLQILRHEEIKYGHDEDEIYGVLFDGAWLWEEYLNTFLKEKGYKHPQNRVGKGGRRIFTEGGEKVMPDFYREHDIVLDAKYKGYKGWDNVQRDDRFQLISYMHIYDVERSGFIVPVRETSDFSLSRTLNGRGGTMSIYGMNVEQDCTSYLDYAEKMMTEEVILAEQIQQSC